MENQLTILSESLDKKLEVLQKIREYNKRQTELSHDVLNPARVPL